MSIHSSPSGAKFAREQKQNPKDWIIILRKGKFHLVKLAEDSRGKRLAQLEKNHG